MKSKARDNLIYLGVALAIAAGFLTYMFWGEGNTGTIRDIPGPILWGIFSTPGIVALVLSAFWKYRNRRALWAIASIVAGANVSAVGFVYWQGWDPPVPWWSIPTGLCMIPIFFAMAKILGREAGGSGKRPARRRSTETHSPGLRARKHE